MRPSIRYVLIISITATTLAVGAPARAESQAPAILAIRLVSAPAPGVAASYELDLADTGGSGAVHAFINLRDPRGYVSSGGASTADNLARTSNRVSPWAASGAWTVESAHVYDAAGNETHYDRDGTVTVAPHGATPPPSPAPDLRVGDFTIDNPDQDVVPPVLSGAHVFSDNVLAGTPALALYSASDERSGVHLVQIAYRRPEGDLHHVSSSGVFAPTGPAAWLLPLAATGGRYEPVSIRIWDSAYNSSIYSADGTVTADPSGIAPQPGPGPSFADLDFEVTPVREDTEAPVLRSLTRESPAVVRAGETIALDYEATDEWTGVRRFVATYEDDAGHRITVRKECGDASGGPASARLATFWEPGPWRLQWVRVDDRMNASTIYWRSGGVQVSPSGQSGPSSNPFDLSAADFTIEPGAPRDGFVSADTSSIYTCINRPEISLQPNSSEVIEGESVAFRGSVGSADGPVARPLVALYGFDAGVARLLGVTTGDDAGAFARSVRAVEGRAFQARFFGVETGVRVDPGLSEPVRLHVSPRETVTLAAGRLEIDRRDRVRLRATVVPAHAGSNVALLRRVDGEWHRVAWGTLSQEGVATFSRRPLRTRSFKVALPAHGDHPRITSNVVTIHVI